MLLSDNTKRVIDLTELFDDLKDIDKIRLAIQILENLHFYTEYDIESFIRLLKNNKSITNFAKYKNLFFISSKYLELPLLEKQKFSVELLFNIFQYDFKNEEIKY